MDFWTKVAFFLLMGFSVSGRAFAYLGIPPAKLFIGDMTLAAFMLFKPRAIFDRWHEGLTRGGPLGVISWILLISILYGVFELVSGILSGFPPLVAFENLVFNIYPLYLFLGIWAGQHRPDLLRKWVIWFAWFLTFYGPLYIAFLDKITWTVPGTDAVIFGQAGGGSVVLLGILCFEKKPLKYWLPLTMGAFMLLATEVRAEWVGFLLAMMIWGFFGKKMHRVALAFSLIGAFLLVGALADITLPGMQSRGGNVSTREIVGRAISSFNPELAQEYSSNAGVYAGTVTWRTTWWKAIRESVMVDAPTFLFGHGYGYPLKDLVPYTRDTDLRTPHSIFYFCLGYGGAVGVAIFFSLQGALAWLLWSTYKLTGQVFGLALWASSLLSAFFGNSFETPFGAIPFYIIMGLAVAPVIQKHLRAKEARHLARIIAHNPGSYALMNSGKARGEKLYARISS